MSAPAAATAKRRSMLPAPRSLGAVGAGAAATAKTGKVAAGKCKETGGVNHAMPSHTQPTGSKVEVGSTAVGSNGNESKGGANTKTVGKLADNLVSVVPGERRRGIESRQMQLRKPSNLQHPAATSKRPSSASSYSNRVTNQSTSVTMTSLDSGNFVKPKGTADHRLFHGPNSASGGSSSDSGIKQKMLSHSTDTAMRKLKVPTSYISGDSSVVEPSLQNKAPKSDSSCLRAETVLTTEPSSVADIPTPEHTAVGTAHALSECTFSGSVKGSCDTVEGQEFGCLDSLSSGDMRDALSRVTLDDSEHLESSSGSLGILNDSDMLDTSLLSFDSNPAPSLAVENEVEDCRSRSEDPPDEVTLTAAELGSKTSASTTEIDPRRTSPSNEISVQSLRPLSLMSNSSTDMGIVADYVVRGNNSRCQQERPSSYLSTSSADTGIC